uniref:Uncharacterized protein n=1 Tax=Octopus bimaculoides TaxID=37653 RepID=A0A0L8G9Q8_OCTBM
MRPAQGFKWRPITKSGLNRRSGNQLPLVLNLPFDSSNPTPPPPHSPPTRYLTSCRPQTEISVPIT